MNRRKITFCLLIYMIVSFSWGQSTKPISSDSLSLEEFIGFVKKYHPIVKQAGLELSEAQAKLLKARGAFDPKLSSNYNRKDFEDKRYFDLFDAGFKIPTWFGVELKAAFEQNEGEFLNPQNNVPLDGLYKAGISVPIGQGLFISERMATLKQAKILNDINAIKRQIIINQLITDAITAFIEWEIAYDKMKLYQNFLNNAKVRFQGIKSSAEAGDRSAIDTVEAKIIVQNRQLQLEKANLKQTKKRLQLSNFLWIDNFIPLEINDLLAPADISSVELQQILGNNTLLVQNFNLKDHPALRLTNFKIDQLEINRRLKAEQLKPQLDLEYNFLSEDPDLANRYNTDNYTAGVKFRMPLFLRKERGDLRLAKIKLRDEKINYDVKQLKLDNKIQEAVATINSLRSQTNIIDDATSNYQRMLEAENRKFEFGESSVFLVNTREQKLIKARIDQININADLLKSKAKLFNVLAKEVTIEQE
jgi:outer membrane protein TolC